MQNLELLAFLEEPAVDSEGKLKEGGWQELHKVRTIAVSERLTNTEDARLKH